MKLTHNGFLSRIALVILALATAAAAQSPIISTPYAERHGRLTRPQRVVTIYDLGAWLDTQVPNSDARATEELALAVREFVQPQMRGTDDLQVVSDHLLVAVGAQPKQEWIETFLTRQTERAEQQLDMTLQIIQLPPGERGPVGPRESRGAQSGTAILNADDRTVFTQILQSRKGIEPTTIESERNRPAAPWTLSALSRSTYVRDRETETIERNGEVFEVSQPVVDVVPLGFKARGSVSWLADDQLGLRVEIDRRWLQGAQQKNEVMPFSETLAPGQTLQIVSENDGQTTLLWITPSRAQEPEEVEEAVSTPLRRVRRSR